MDKVFIGFTHVLTRMRSSSLLLGKVRSKAGLVHDHKIYFFVVVLFLSLRPGFLYVALAVLELLCRSASNTHGFACVCLP